MPNAKIRQLRRKQRRKKKLHHLRRQLATTRDLSKRDRLIKQILDLSPAAPIADYLSEERYRR